MLGVGQIVVKRHRLQGRSESSAGAADELVGGSDASFSEPHRT